MTKVSWTLDEEEGESRGPDEEGSSEEHGVEEETGMLVDGNGKQSTGCGAIREGEPAAARWTDLLSCRGE